MCKFILRRCRFVDLLLYVSVGGRESGTLLHFKYPKYWKPEKLACCRYQDLVAINTADTHVGVETAPRALRT